MPPVVLERSAYWSDPRERRRRWRSLVAVLFTARCAVLAGACPNATAAVEGTGPQGSLKGVTDGLDLGISGVWLGVEGRAGMGGSKRYADHALSRCWRRRRHQATAERCHCRHRRGKGYELPALDPTTTE